MTIDFVQKARFLKAELDAFHRTLEHHKDEEAREQACHRLRKALNHVEALAEDPGGLWQYLPEEQRWGWLRLVSYVGVAMHELKRRAVEKKREEWSSPRQKVALSSAFAMSPAQSFSSPRPMQAPQGA
jgi:hypothetical protein